ncbi:MAG: hypothetical protein EZS28_012198 [Streblomastix strix]|uniref:Uncharacterized protein n=1 Tax=Streblomastix strix TaxID=222440 RepID=A0A5J4WC85_9EUKA|nr:MAG: hypothetical protein EZS28_012198 [Streblomastix strix]
MQNDYDGKTIHIYTMSVPSQFNINGDPPIEILNNKPEDIEVVDIDKHQKMITIGIVRDSYDIPNGVNCLNFPHNQHIALFTGYRWPISGCVLHNGIQTSGNIGFNDDQKLRLEFDSEKGTLRLFIDGVQQPVQISGIKEKVRFVV